METQKERLERFIGVMGYSTREFERAIGVSNATITHVKDTLSANLKEKISANFQQLNMDWLLTGEGEMLKVVASRVLSGDNSNREDTERQPRDSRETDHLQNIPPNYKRLPLVTQTAVAGFGNANFAIHEADVKEYYIVPKFRYHQVDFMIEISGSSMYPKYNSGDVVACTILHDGSFIQWNKCHIVATREQGILCKRLMPGSTDDRLKMVSDNENYPPFEVPKDEITGIALVVGVIRLE